MKRVAVYCGANPGKNPIYTQAAIDVADWLAQHHLDLVYGGGGVGLMNVLAERAIKNGTYTIGIMPQFLVDREIAAPHLDEFYVTDDMDERKAKMLSLADACLALPGGPGTLEEISEAFSWARVGQNPNPCAFYNVNGYYDKLADFFDHMVTEGFLTSANLNEYGIAVAGPRLVTKRAASSTTTMSSWNLPSASPCSWCIPGNIV